MGNKYPLAKLFLWVCMRKEEMSLGNKAIGNKMLDTISYLRHANIILPYLPIRLELSKLRVALFQVTKMSLRTPDPFIHICEGCNETTLAVHCN